MQDVWHKVQCQVQLSSLVRQRDRPVLRRRVVPHLGARSACKLKSQALARQIVVDACNQWEACSAFMRCHVLQALREMLEAGKKLEGRT